VNSSTGEVSILDHPATLPVLTSRARQTGNRWFVLGVNGASDLGLPYQLFELFSDPPGTFRNNSLYTTDGSTANPGSPGSGIILTRSLKTYPLDLLPTSNSLLVSVANAFTADSNLDSFRAPGDTDPAVGVIYRLGCP
jgi:hypothetical protein